jgi:hypothetical protein
MQHGLALQHFLSVELQTVFFAGSAALTDALGAAESVVVTTTVDADSAGVAAAGVSAAGDFATAVVESAARIIPAETSTPRKTHTLRIQPPRNLCLYWQTEERLAITPATK